MLPASVEEFLAHRTEGEALILNLFLALQECSDLALHVVSARGLGVPGDVRSAFELLAKAGMIDGELGSKLAAAVGLRNRIAHEYTGLDLRRVYESARDLLGDLEGFAAAVVLLPGAE